MLSLSGRHCIITGGSRGIGLAIAHRFASEGASITLVGRDQTTLDNAVKELPIPLHQGTPPNHGACAFNVKDSSRWSDMVTFMRDAERKVDVLVNAAGISQNSFMFKTSLHQAKEIVDVNLMGTMYGCQLLLPTMMRQKSGKVNRMFDSFITNNKATPGCIINISSLLATHAGRGAAAYAASKAGVVSLTRALAWEAGRFGIRANVILPGYIETDMTKSMSDDDLKALIPMGRLGKVAEVADAAAFLAKNPYAHNTVLNLDGGLSAT
ncbi:short chain dehydrogenase [Pseudomassariella vexata]|uniref:Short chain dehydrogenase n=1 Tax=Pseudomassariella vexata TaxID=1141098 RepID=A0A1Y2DCI6_9PEZI|nr:short chain dehydrogenase [Pseudomassariella vexata]ORY56983.1 short chain dehydrogenase [Pseudomassariella vexata]